MADKLVSAARFDGGDSVQAFPLGGRVAPIFVGALNPRPFLGMIAGKTSLVMLAIPAGRTLYVGNFDQIGDATGADARALMFPLAGPAVFTATLLDGEEGKTAILADADFTLPVLQAATLGEE